MMPINRTDFASTLILAEAMLWSEMAEFAYTVFELDCNFNPTGFTLPSGRYPFVPRELVPRWDDDYDDAMAVALFELSQPGASGAFRKGKFPPEFGGRILMRVQQGFLVLIGAGAARKVMAWPKPKPAAATVTGPLFEEGA